MANKNRVEWSVRLQHYNLSEGNDIHPRVVLRDTLNLRDLALRLEDRTRGIYRADETELILKLLTEVATDALIEGYALNTPLGRLTPVVTGMWNFNRIQPAARAQNQASLSYALSPELKKAFSNPLFRVESQLVQGPRVFDVFDLESQTHNRLLTPGGHVYIKGKHLLMNGDSPLRGVELLDAETQEVVHRYPAEVLERYMNSRRQLVIILPDNLPDGTYRLAVTSQCTTSPKPLKKPLRYVNNTTLRVGAEPADVDPQDGEGGEESEEIGHRHAGPDAVEPQQAGEENQPRQ